MYCTFGGYGQGRGLWIETAYRWSAVLSLCAATALIDYLQNSQTNDKRGGHGHIYEAISRSRDKEERREMKTEEVRRKHW